MKALQYVKPLDKIEVVELKNFYGKNETKVNKVSFLNDLFFGFIFSKLYIFYTSLTVVYFFNKEYMSIVLIQLVLWCIFIIKRIDYEGNFKNL